MTKRRKPRKGSLQIWPRVRAKRIYTQFGKVIKTEKVVPLGFAGYKVGMTQVSFTDERPNSLTKSEKLVWPATILECPPLKVLGLRAYKNSPYGTKAFTQVLSSSFDKNLKRKLKLPEKYDQAVALKKVETALNDIYDIKLMVYTQPKISAVGKKRPEVFEVPVGGNTVQEKYEFCKNKLDKEISIREVFKVGDLVDIHSVTKGKGFQGSIKRFGIYLKQKKTEKGQRRPGTLGSWTPKKVPWNVAMAGQMGYHQRTDYNKELVFIGEDPKEINPASGFSHYGLVKSNFILIKGSVGGVPNRLILFNLGIRKQQVKSPIDVRGIKK